jgi:hypothetical membrane protein
MPGIILGFAESVHYTEEQYAGACLFLAGVVVFLGIMTAEALYPGYSTSANTISDLGGTLPPESLVILPSAAVFDAAMIVAGLLGIGGAYLLQRAVRDGWVTVPLAVFGIGVFGVGIFNGTYGTVHALFAFLAFVGGAISAILAARIETSPFREISVILGIISLSALALFFFQGVNGPVAILGIGGLERWVAYPVALWVTGFGGYLLGFSAAVVRGS